MFSILRFIVIVGVIFYYSPVRQKDDGPDILNSFLQPKRAEPAPEAAAPPAEDAASGRLETMWQALPEGAKQAVIEKILTTSGLGMAETRSADTLQPGDRQPAWQGGMAKPRS